MESPKSIIIVIIIIIIILIKISKKFIFIYIYIYIYIYTTLLEKYDFFFENLVNFNEYWQNLLISGE